MIELSQYRDLDHFLAVHTLGNYWKNLAVGAVPYRSNLDPRRLIDALRNIVLNEIFSLETHVFGFLRGIFATS